VPVPPTASSAGSAAVKAYDIRGIVPDELDAEVARVAGSVLAAITRPADGADHPGVIVGRDARTSSPQLAAALIEGVLDQGVDVTDIGLASTDLVYYAAGTLDQPAAMVTASHNPGRYNGIKMCRAGAVPVSRNSGLGDVAAALDADEPMPRRGTRGTVRTADLLADYVAYLHRLVPLGGLRPLRVVVDAGNGMAGLTVPPVFADTPVQVDGLYLELDGQFPNHEANPLDTSTLADLQHRVRTTDADLGLAFDGDADRCFVVDERGELVTPSAITALIAQRELERHPGAPIIYNLITSRAVREVIEENGGVPVRTRVGHSFIKATMAQTGAVFGGEHSGHYYFADFWRADSGLLAALHVLAALGSTPDGTTLRSLVGSYERYARSGEVNSTVADPTAVLRAAEREYGARAGITLDHLDGLTVSTGPWWFNLRPSNTEPLLRLNVEAGDDGTMEVVRDEVLAFVADHGRQVTDDQAGEGEL
jgi:phosphomannomutase